ncbi:MAG: carboxymuconolactone decarboxylase family protein [Myxococcota bacterium]
MRLNRPRIAPVTREEVGPEFADRLPKGPGSHVVATLARHLELVSKWAPLGNYLRTESSLSERERELAVLRVAWLSQAEYQWAEHVGPALAAGLSREEVECVSLGSEAEAWSESDRAILRATEELHSDAFISDETWRSLEGFTDERRLDLIFTVGNYMMISMALNSLGVQLEEGVSGFPTPAPPRDKDTRG